MNINIVLRCNTCSKTTHCRIGVSYKKNQSLRFACPTCMSPIDVLLKYQTSIMDTSLSWEGAEPADNQTLSEADHFVDLHLDFPTYYGEYEPGITPFIRATRVIGFEDIQNFVCQPVNRPYLELAMKLSSMSREKLRSVAEGLLDITL